MDDTIEYLDVALRAQNVGIDKVLLTKIVRTLDFVREKGSEATLSDVARLEHETREELEKQKQ